MDKSKNRKTIEAYDANVDAYIQHTPKTYTTNHIPLTNWIDGILAVVRPGGKVLEIGSATPRDAQYMRSKGFDVLCSDGTPGFVEKMREQGEPAVLLNILEDDIESSAYDLVFANAVLPHFTVSDLDLALKKIYAALKPGGIFAFNVKEGKGETWIDEKFQSKRFTHYWQLDDLHQLVKASGYELLPSDSGIVGDRPNDIWLRVIAQKPHAAN